MSTLPKSVVVGGRRYPTWALSLRAREQLINLDEVNKHIAELRQRLAFYNSARDICQRSLREALPKKPITLPESRYYWQIVSLEWARANWPVKAPILNLHCFGAASHYREDDRVLVYVKSYGVVGWGNIQVDKHNKQCYIIWRFMVAELKDAIPAKALKDFAVRHPNRVSQMLPSSANVVGLLQTLESKPAARNVAE